MLLHISYRIQAAAAVRLEGLKEMSALGMEYAIQKHAALDIQVNSLPLPSAIVNI